MKEMLSGHMRVLRPDSFSFITRPCGLIRVAEFLRAFHFPVSCWNLEKRLCKRSTGDIYHLLR